MDKSRALLSFLQTCPEISATPLFFNFGNVEDNAHQAIINSDDVALHTPFIDGSVAKRFTFSIDSFKSVAYNPVTQEYLANDENLTEFEGVQQILDWVTAQEKLNNYPNFGTDCIIDEMKVLTTKPELVGVDTSLNPPMAVYRLSIQIDYIDNTDKAWK